MKEWVGTGTASLLPCSDQWLCCRVSGTVLNGARALSGVHPQFPVHPEWPLPPQGRDGGWVDKSVWTGYEG